MSFSFLIGFVFPASSPYNFSLSFSYSTVIWILCGLSFLLGFVEWTPCERIPELEASVDRKNVLTKATEYAASTVKYGGKNNDPKELRATRKQLTDSVTFHAATLVALSVKTYSGGGGGARNTQMNKARPGLHLCVQCKRDVYHKEGNCLELAANEAKRYKGWTSVFE